MLLRGIFIIFCSLFWCLSAHAQTYGQRICKHSPYYCYQVKPGDSWNNLFPYYEGQDLVRRLNRMNVPLRPGMVIAIPKDLRSLDKMDISPFPSRMSPSNTSVIRVNQSELAWGAYDPSGRLVNWGPISGGKSYCSDVKRGCRTITGNFTIYKKQGPGCISHKFPLPRGGAKMPYCMHFHKGYALHGSSTVPGRHDSHGCVRLFIEDAQWLNHNFIRVGSTRVLIK